MNQMFKVFSFELRQKLREKSFYVTTIILAIIMFLLGLAPTLFNMFSNDDSDDMDNSTIVEEEVEDLQKDTLGIVYQGEISQSLIDEFEKVYEVSTYTSEDDLKNDVENETITEGIILFSDLEAKSIKNNAGFLSTDSYIEDILRNNYRYNILLKDADITREQLEEFDNVYATVEVESVGRNNVASYILSYASIMFMYFMILTQGQIIATSVAREKDNRTMEILITTVKPKALIWGKVLSGVVTSLLAFLTMVIAGLAGFMITLSQIPMISEILKNINFTIGALDLLIFVVFLLLGITLYYLMYAALGSLVSKLDQLGQALTPVTIPVVIAFLVPMMNLATPDSMLMKIASFVPFTSPIAMFARYQLANVSFMELLASIAILVISVVIVGIMAAKIYRSGTLNYGNRMKITKALKSENK